MPDGSTPGNGSTSPFGNGNGNVGESRSMSNNFVENPQGSGRGGSKPRDFVDQTEMTTQTARNKNDPTTGINTDNAAAGPLTAAEVADASGNMSGGEIGVGSIGNSQKPFALGGGGA